ncbi:MAG: putative Phosphatidylinositol N-acetylglucosaminyltransferase [Nitrospira sp.]|nr:MAG: putative Phosphatidylinositol N-acetylglucosaminyltransferase [Nitrospira sp.]
MRVAFDFTAFIPQMTGIDTYLKQLVWHLAKVDRTSQYRIYHNHEDRYLFAEGLPENVSHASLSARPRPIRLASQQIFLPAAATLWGADVVHSPSFIMPYLRGMARHVLTVHDMTSFSHPQCHIALRRSALYRRMVLVSLNRADVVVAPSQATRQAILEFLPNLDPDRIHVTVPGIGEEFRPCDPASVRGVVARLALPDPYILYVGTLEPRKNIPVLVEAYRRLVEAGAIKERLVLAGKLGWGYEALLEQIQAPALRGKVHLAGYVSQQDLPALYAGARLFVYPSLHEGFGFPPLEAMACGVPVISTRSSSLTENLEAAAELVAPDDVVGLADAMRRLLSDDRLRAKRQSEGLEQARQYRWDQTARATVKSYQAAMNMARR